MAELVWNNGIPTKIYVGNHIIALPVKFLLAQYYIVAKALIIYSRHVAVCRAV
jgi:hypothetical protein